MANPKLSTLQDFFGGSAINTAVWNGSSGAPDVTLDTTLDRVAIACQSYYPILSATGPYDATGSSLYARVTPAPVGNGSTQTIMRIALDANNRVTFYTDGGQILTARVTNAGVNTDQIIGPYDPYNHAWWRIREQTGNILFDTSPDGYTWTNRASTAYTWSATAVSVVFLCGFYATESAGMSAYVDHVNTLSSAPGQPNLNWPRAEDAWGPIWNANGGDAPLDRYVEVTDRTRGTVSVTRGRQYELDQVRAGEAAMTLANTDAALDPTNASGPWYGHIQPYQPYRRRAQWPPSRNLLDQVAATGGDLGGYALGAIPQGSAGADIFSITDSSGGSFVSTSAAWQGTTVMQFAVPSGSTSPTRIMYTPRWSVIPGQTYTLTLQIRNITASTSLNVQAFLGFYDAHSNSAGPATFAYGTPTTLTGSATAAWTTLTVTATAPANAAGLGAGAALAANAAATCSVQVDGMQLEKGSTATTWTCPGVWYPIYAGYMERWPSSWDMQGTYGSVQPTAVDALSLLSQRQLNDSLTEEINERNPRFLYRLADPAGSLTFTDSTGTFVAAPIKVSKNGAGTLTSGTAITAASTAGLYTGSSDTVVTVANPSPGAAGNAAASYISLDTAGVKGPIDPTLWTRVIAFRYTGPTPSDAAVIWSSSDAQRGTGGVPSGSRIYLSINSSGQLVLVLSGANGSSVTYGFTASNIADSNWHLAIFGYSASLGQLLASIDGNLLAYFFGVSTSMTPTNIVCDSVGGIIDPVKSTGLGDNYQGDISFACEFPYLFANSDITNLYAAWRNACSGESTNARYARLLRYAGFTGPSTLQTGLTTSMGPASDISGQDAVTALQAVVDTENGEHFVDRQGFIQFRSRSARYNATVPVYTFGENTAAGEWPYEDAQLDFDSTHLSNQVTVTQQSSSQSFYAQDATSIQNYFPRTLTRTVNSSSTLECQDAADYLLSRYKTPATRISSIKLHPSAMPALWPVCLSIELGTRVRVMRRPPGLSAIQVDCFVEQIQVDMDDTGEAWWTLQCSPADLTPYAIFTSLHMTLASTIASGVTSITINAGADNTNPAAAQIGLGQQLVLGLGTVNQETVTVLSVGATTSGWTTATITLQAATTKSHTAADVVCEPLPTGVTSATKYDSSALFDSSAFAY
ncbi:hypothetical protein AB0D11_02650 [Streptomyces monashensis]|uniref:hypothetical protein n=1 Tax=Streptomyces monashensis TaxID=1678012 RepID=UPI0033FA83E5